MTPSPDAERAASDPSATPAAGSTKRFLFRFGLLYFLLNSHTFPLWLVPNIADCAEVFGYTAGWLEATADVNDALSDYSTLYGRGERAVVDAVAEHVLGITQTLDRPYGSGDPLYSYVLVVLHLLGALGLATIWTRLARGRGSYERLAAWTLIALRLYVGFAMLSYGLSKVMPTQFPPWVRLDRLLAPYGDSTPMNVLWTAMRSSEAYTIFGGAGEVVGGILLMFRRTATLGALTTAGVMANVVAMNFCFDVPVKLYSSHLLLGALIIALPDLRRLFDVLLRNRPTTPRDMTYPRLPWMGSVAKFLVLVPYLVIGVDSRLKRMQTYEELPTHYGIWDTSEFTLGGTPTPLLANAPGVWKHLVIDRGGRCSIHRMDGTRMGQELEQEAADALTLTSTSDWEVAVAGDTMQLDGQFAWRFLGDVGDDSSTLEQENRHPQMRWTLERLPTPAPQSSAVPDTGAAHEPSETTQPAPQLEPWIGTWRVTDSELLGDLYSPRFQPAPARFTTLEFGPNGELFVTLPSGRRDEFSWERTEDRRTTLRLTARGEFGVERDGSTMRLSGTFRGHALEVTLTERDLSEFHLRRRGFHWISPIPWNRF